MGIDHDAALAIGFCFTDYELEKTFSKLVKNEEISHMEDRYDPKTGKKLPAVKVIDSLEDLAQKICDEIGCSYWSNSDMNEGWSDTDQRRHRHARAVAQRKDVRRAHPDQA